VQVEKRLMFIILTLIVAVAAFNLVSTLVMTVDRQAGRHRHLAHAGRHPALDHGHLHGARRGVRRDRHPRGRGLRPAGRLQHRRHRAGHRAGAARELPAGQHLPHQPHAERTAKHGHRAIVVISLVLAFVATLYPSWRASRVQPAEALRYE
jgi:lipoprotein-releasing system permease protein